MTMQDRIDPEVRAPLDGLLGAFPGGFNAIPDIVARRELVAAVLAAGSEGVPPNDRVTSKDLVAPGRDGHPEAAVRVYRPVAATGTLPGIFYIHGGGMILGSVEMEDASAAMLCEMTGCVVVSVEYRLAPENPFPAAPEDCYTGLVWMASNAAELGVDPERIALYGPSAGGGLVLAVALMSRDRGFPSIRMQMPIYPMIDDRNDTPSSREITDVGIWDRDGNLEAWGMYLGADYGTDNVSHYAAPARATDLSGLPPTFIDVGEVDMFRDEDIAFAARLIQAGVPTELHVHPGAYHAAEVFAPTAALSQRMWAMRVDALRRSLFS